ncbi:MAG: PdxA family dehydrogenase, partial [bacterium]
MSRPVIAVTMGDPAGVGPEICLQALNDPRVLGACVPVVVGNAQLLQTLAGRLGIPFRPERIHPDDLAAGVAPEGPTVVDMHTLVIDDIVPGRMDAACGHAAYDYVRFAIDRAMTGDFDAVTTAPLCKEALHAADIRFPGHTEILESQTGARGVVMMLTSPAVTVSLVTAHMPLGRVPRAISAARVERVIRLTHANMALILERSPRLAVLGLN